MAGAEAPALPEGHAGPGESAEDFCARKDWRPGDRIESNHRMAFTIVGFTLGYADGDDGHTYDLARGNWSRSALCLASVLVELDRERAAIAARFELQARSGTTDLSEVTMFRLAREVRSRIGKRGGGE